MVRRDLSPQQRAGSVILLLAQGEQLTTAEIAQIMGMTWQGAWAMMGRLSGIAPLICDKGTWYLIRSTRR